MSDQTKILLTGVCYVHRLLQLRYDAAHQLTRRNYIHDVHPDFDLAQIDFFRERIAEQFVFTDFHGKYSSIESEASNLVELLELYEPSCRRMYVVGGVGISNLDMAEIVSPADYKRLSAFWYFLFNENWNPHQVRQWADQRDRALLALFARFPGLRFIVYEQTGVDWWHRQGLPADRLLHWQIDWGMSRDDFEQLRQQLLDKGLGGGHRFPTESSYNDLCDMILEDARR